MQTVYRLDLDYKIYVDQSEWPAAVLPGTLIRC